MSYYNWKAYREYIQLAQLARETGEGDDLVKELEERAAYFWRLSGGDLNAKTPYHKQRKKAKQSDSGAEGFHYDFGEEWNQDINEEGT